MPSRPTIIIPARFGSTRLRGKPLRELNGKSLIRWVYEAAARTGFRAVVATDDDRIMQHCRDSAIPAAMTGECANGTERCAEAADTLGIEGPIVNWQGDSPLIPPDWVHALLAALDEDPFVSVATPVQPCSEKQARELKSEYFSRNPGGTMAVFDDRFRAMFFSKAPIPSRGPHWMHIGIYAYRREVLASYGHAASPLEQSERLEQLRFLERNVHIQCVPVDGEPVWEVNNPSDIGLVEAMLRGEDGTMR